MVWLAAAVAPAAVSPITIAAMNTGIVRIMRSGLPVVVAVPVAVVARVARAARVAAQALDC